MEKSSEAKSSNKLSSLNYKKALIILVIIALAVTTFYFYNQYQKANSLLQNPNQATTEESKKLLAQVGKLIELPAGENPTIATVSDKTKLIDQPLFAHAQNGDKVIYFPNSGMLILFRPSINKIISVGTANVAQPPVQTQVTPISTPTVSPTPAFVPPTVTPVPTISQ